VVIVSVMLGLGFWQTRAQSSSASIVVSAPLRQVLADGSVVELRDQAEMGVEFTASLRRVVLLRGEAHFQVAKDPVKPFVVQVGAIEVRAVGTAFTVNIGRTATELLVTEGRVAVEKPARPSGGPTAATSAAVVQSQSLAFVDAGNRAVVAAGSAQVQPISEAETSERLAWRVPQLEFSGTPLVDAVAMMNRYNEIQFVLADPALDRLQLSGFLRVDKTATFIRLLESNFGLVAERRGAREIVLRRPF